MKRKRQCDVCPRFVFPEVFPEVALLVVVRIVVGLIGAGHRPPDFCGVPSELLGGWPVTVKRHEYDFARNRAALEGLVHLVGNMAAARMAHDVDLVRWGRFDSGNHRTELLERL